MSYRDISICISSLESEFGLIEQAHSIADAWGARLNCCAVGVHPAPTYTDGFMGGQGEFQALMQAAQDNIQAFKTRLKQYFEDK
ncbi:MAG TPA: hypothetical protein PKY73_12975, partial [Hyphomonas sp.]|nr:hypothetical protein [Hyphomonas sp.]